MLLRLKIIDRFNYCNREAEKRMYVPKLVTRHICIYILK